MTSPDERVYEREDGALIGGGRSSTDVSRGRATTTSRRRGGARARLLWDTDHLLAETDSTLVTRVAEYAYAPGVDRPLALLTPGAGGTTKLRYYHQDEVGNVIGLTDTTAVVQALEYTPWGELAPSTVGTVGDTTRLRWKGLLWEEGKTQLYYVRNRWYDAGARRFISEDPIGIDGGLNLYAFAGNDPVNYSDPSGLCPEGEELAVYVYPDRVSTQCVARGGGIYVRGFFGGGQSGVTWGAFNFGLGFVPGAGDAQGAYEAIGGHSIGGGSLSTGERAFAAAGALVPFVSGSQLRVGTDLLRDFLRNRDGWRSVGAFTEAARNRRARGGLSIQVIFENIFGDRVVEHTVVDRFGRVIDAPHPRPMYKPRAGDIP